MKTLKWMVAGVVVGAVAVAFRDIQRGAWLSPAGAGSAAAVDEEEPVLGYDGMDQETLLDWLDSSDLDPDTVEKMMRYERANQDRLPVIEALAELLE